MVWFCLLEYPVVGEEEAVAAAAVHALVDAASMVVEAEEANDCHTTNYFSMSLKLKVHPGRCQCTKLLTICLGGGGGGGGGRAPL